MKYVVQVDYNSNDPHKSQLALVEVNGELELTALLNVANRRMPHNSTRILGAVHDLPHCLKQPVAAEMKRLSALEAAGAEAGDSVECQPGTTVDTEIAKDDPADSGIRPDTFRIIRIGTVCPVYAYTIDGWNTMRWSATPAYFTGAPPDQIPDLRHIPHSVNAQRPMMQLCGDTYYGEGGEVLAVLEWN